jgi:hypothetical protein
MRTRWLSLWLCLAGAVLAAPAAALTVRGTVTEAAGSPAGGGTVWFGSSPMTPPIEGGRFEFAVDDPAAGDQMVAYCSAAGALWAARQVRVRAGQPVLQVAIKIGEEPVLVGRVVADDFPEGIPAAPIALRRETGLPFEGQLYSSRDGTFRLEGHALQGTRVSTFPLHHLPSEWVEVKPPYPMRVTLRCPRETPISGRVLDNRGNPVAGAHVIAITAGDTSCLDADDSGAFAFTWLKPSTYRITAGGRYVEPANTLVEVKEGAPVTGLVMRLARLPVHTLAGRVVGPDGGRGVAGATVQIEDSIRPIELNGQPASSSRGCGHGVLYPAVSGPSGRFALDLPVMPVSGHGLWSVEVKAEGYVLRRYVVAAPLDPSASVMLQVFHGGRVTGRVLPHDGKPVQGARVSVDVATEHLGRGEAHGVSTFSADVSPTDGSFSLGPVLPGEHHLVVDRGGEVLAEQEVVVKEGKETKVQVRAAD